MEQYVVQPLTAASMAASMKLYSCQVVKASEKHLDQHVAIRLPDETQADVFLMKSSRSLRQDERYSMEWEIYSKNAFRALCLLIMDKL